MIKHGDVLAEVEDDKATMELDSYQEGVLLHIHVKEGPVPVDSIIAILGEEGEDYEHLLKEEEKEDVTEEKEEEKKEETPKPQKESAKGTKAYYKTEIGLIKTTPLASNISSA